MEKGVVLVFGIINIIIFIIIIIIIAKLCRFFALYVIHLSTTKLNRINFCTADIAINSVNILL